MEQLWFADRDDWCPAGVAVREPIDIDRFSTIRPSGDDWIVIVTHFNPCGYRRLRETYQEWLPSVESIRDLIRVYELVFDGQEPEIDGSIVVRGSHGSNGVWQKEALINRAIAETDAKIIAWVDHDLLFENHRWLADGIERIRSGEVACQLFSQLKMTAIDRTVIERKASAMANGGKGCPGGAWVADAEYLRAIGGLETSNLFGGGDQTFLDAMLGNPSWHLSQYSKPMQEQLAQWINRAVELRRDRAVGCVDGLAYHLWHGSRANRQYSTRYQVLTKFDFDPASDLFINDQGLLEWTRKGSQLAQEVLRFFEARREDDAE